MPAQPMLPTSREFTLRCRVVFVEVRRGRMLLDCVLADPVRLPGHEHDAGSPFVIAADLPAAMWATVARGLLERWTADSRELEVRLRPRRDVTQVGVSDGRTRVLLDLAGHAGC